MSTSFYRIDKMKASPFGMLMVELTGSNGHIAQAIEFLQETQVGVEVLD